jgi:hypothetical protein
LETCRQRKATGYQDYNPFTFVHDTLFAFALAFLFIYERSIFCIVALLWRFTKLEHT